MSRLFWMSWTVLLLLLAMARAGQIWTLDGQTANGEVAVDPAGTLRLAGKDGLPSSFELNRILFASFHAPVPADAPSGALVAGMLRQSDVGTLAKSGSMTLVNGIYTLKSTAAGLGGNADSFDFFAHPFQGNGEIVTHVVDLPAGPPASRIGPMMRAATTPDARYAMVYVTAAGNVGFRFRKVDGGPAVDMPGPKVKPPIWLTLIRNDRQIWGYRSENGTTWQLVGRAFNDPRPAHVQPNGPVVDAGIAMNELTYAGLAMMGGGSEPPAVASVEQVSFLERSHPLAPYAVSARGHIPKLLSLPLELSAKGILTRDGTFLANATIASVDGKNIRLAWGKRHGLTVGVSQVARINLRELATDAATSLHGENSGVLLTNGDFVTGDIVGIDDGRVSVSSVVFGLARYALANEVQAILCRPAATVPTSFGLDLTDGSVLAAQSVKVSATGDLLVDESALGALTVPTAEVGALRAGGKRAALLTDLVPTKIDSPSGQDAIAGSGLDPAMASWLTIAGQTCRRGILVGGQGSLTYRLDAHYQTFVCRAGVPASESTGAGAVRFVVLADGKEVFRSPPLTSKNPPIVISVHIAGARELTLATETTAGADAPCFGLWTDPLLGT